MALAVGHAQCVAGEALLARERERDGGIHAAGNQHDGGFLRMTSMRPFHPSTPGSSLHRILCSCSWKRTGRRSARIQSASSRGASCAVAPARTAPCSVRPARVRRARRAPIRSRRGRRCTNLIWSCAQQMGEIRPQVARALAGTRRLQIDDLAHARIDLGDVESRRRFPARPRSRHRTAARAATGSASAPAARRR